MKQQEHEDDDPEKRRDREENPPDEVKDQFDFSGMTDSSGVPHQERGPGQKP